MHEHARPGNVSFRVRREGGGDDPEEEDLEDLEDLDRMLDLARRAARLGGDVVRRGVAGPAELKGVGDYVTEIDRASERAIGAALAAETPDVPVLGEEEGGSVGDRYWVVDPLDGTTNFLHRFPVVGVSVALVVEGVPVVGVVHAPLLGGTWLGARGLGAWIERGEERSKLHVSDRPTGGAVVATGYPFRDKGKLPHYTPVMLAALERFEDLRRAGAASLDLAWVAEGVFDGFFELGLSAWDVAAGGLLIQEAGGRVSDWAGGERWLTGDILAGSPHVHSALTEITRS